MQKATTKKTAVKKREPFDLWWDEMLPRTPLIVFDLTITYSMQDDANQEQYTRSLTNILQHDVALITQAAKDLKKVWKIEYLSIQWSEPRIIDITKYIYHPTFLQLSSASTWQSLTPRGLETRSMPSALDETQSIIHSIEQLYKELKVAVEKINQPGINKSK